MRCPGRSGRSGPELALEALLGLVDGALVGAGGEVLPAAVGRPRTRCRPAPRALTALAAWAERGVQDRAGGDAGEDALELEQLADPAYGVARADREPRVDQRRRRTARGRSPRRGCAGRRPARRTAARRRRSCTSGLCSRKNRPTPISVPVVPRPATKWVTVGQVGQDLGAGALVVRERRWPGCRTGRASPSRGAPRRAAWPTRTASLEPPAAGEEMISAPHIAQQLAALARRCSPASRRPSGSPRAWPPSPARCRCCPTSARGSCSRAAAAPSFSASSIIRSAGRSLIEPVGLRSSSLAHSRTSARRRQPRQPDQRRTADRVEQVVVAHHAEPSAAGDRRAARRRCRRR